jgi:DNA-directed RNA polymerase alpha subunit
MNDGFKLALMQNSVPEERRTACLGCVEIALIRGNREEAYAAIDFAFREDSEPVTLDSPIATLRLPERITGALERAGIFSVGALTSKSGFDLRSLWNFGESAIDQVRTVLARHGFGLRGKSMRELDKA